MSNTKKWSFPKKCHWCGRKVHESSHSSDFHDWCYKKAHSAGKKMAGGK